MSDALLETRTVQAACPHDCPDTCALRVTVEGDRVVKVQGHPEHRHTRGVLCTKVSRYAERTDHTQRVLTPLRRVGAKGEGRFEPVSWDEALSDIASRLKAIAARDPQAIVPYSYAGTLGLLQGESMSARFFHRLGASRLDRTICASAGGEALLQTYGGKVGMHVQHFAESRLIVLWGTNTIASNLHLWSLVQEAKRRGATLIAIDPRRTETADKCDRHIALRPGTDGALALGLMHELVAHGWLDHAWLADHVEGWPELRERALQWPPERAAQVCGITPGEVQALARDYGTTAPAAIRLNYGMQRVKGGGNAVRLIALLPCLTGAWRHRAGGLLLSASGWFASVRNDALLQRPDLFTVVLEHFLTDTADHADCVLPATTQLEHLDVHTSYGHTDVLLSRPAIPPRGQSLPNTEIFRRLAHRMGWTDPCFADDDETLARQSLNDTVDWAALGQRGWWTLPLPDAPFAEGGFPTSSGKARACAPGLPLPDHVPNHECADTTPELARRHPLAMISPPARHFLNSTFVNLQSLRDIEGEPLLEMNPVDAAARGIADGQPVRVFNDRGEHHCVARVSTRAREGVVHGLGIWWRKLGRNGTNVNELTHQHLTDLGRAPAFYDCLVEVLAIPSSE